jgi:serine/threonine protein kinase
MGVVAGDLLKDNLLESVPVHEGYKVLGGVVLCDRVGKGGMGSVYRGRHIRLNVDVAVKVMSLPSDMPKEDRVSCVQRFLREARTAASVRHQNLIRVADVDAQYGLYFLTMDFIDGESAANRLDRKLGLTEAEAVEICLGAAEGLGEAHAQGVVHRDVKPDNIMIDKKGRITLTDLGLAKAYEGHDGGSGLTMAVSITRQMMGTPYYMSPEQTRSSKDVGPTADVWSLGVTLYELATTRLPWDEDDLHDQIHRIRFDPYLDPKALRPNLSDGLRPIFLKSLAKNPDKRFSDCGQMACALREHLQAIAPQGISTLPDEAAGSTRRYEKASMPPSQEVVARIADAIDSVSASRAESARVITQPTRPGGRRDTATPPTITHAGAKPEVTLDDRTSWPVAGILVKTIAALSPTFADVDAVWDAFMKWTKRDRREYELVRRTAHSIFYYQLQDCYEFGMEHLKRDDLPLLSGRAFSETVYEDMLPQLLQVALRSSGTFQDAIIEVFSSYLYRYTGSRYLLEGEIRPEDTIFHIKSRTPEAGVVYCKQYGLNPVRAFRNSFLYIAGAMEELLTRIVADFKRDQLRAEPLQGMGNLYIPITSADHFAFEGISQTLASYVRRVEERSSNVVQADRLESDLAASSEAMRLTWNRITRASHTDELVLLRGESGTGKSYIAKKIHMLSARSTKPFIEVGLASEIGSDNDIQKDLFGAEDELQRQKGLFSLADGGTIFLDEVGDASLELQAKLLRVIEKSTFKRLGGVNDVSVDVRVVAATSLDLEEMVEEGTFRRDLYYRLNVITIHLPPLRERPEDIPALAEYLLNRSAGKGDVEPKLLGEGVAEKLSSYTWPGNIRELDHALKHAATMAEGSRIRYADLPRPVIDFLNGRD